MQATIKLRAFKICDGPFYSDYCTCEQAVPDGEHYIVNFPFIENEYYYDILFGDQCECLEPPSASVRK